MTPTENNFRTLLSIYRKGMTKAQRKRTRNLKPKAITYPFGIETEYARRVKESVSPSITRINELILPFVRRNIRLDGVTEDLEAVIEQAYTEIDTRYGKAYLPGIGLGYVLEDILQKVFDKNSAFLQREIIARAGVPLNVPYPWWEDVKTLWAKQNYTLIKNLSVEYVQKVNTIILTGLQQGLPQDNIIENLLSLSERMTTTRANLIARDQIGKLNSAIAQKQYASIGVDNYYWLVRDDERLRGSPRGIYPKAVPSHFEMAGLLMKWSDPNVYSSDGGKTWLPKTMKMEPLQVGQAIFCRCSPMPSWTQYMEEIDGEDI